MVAISKEEEVQKISTSIFVTNFSDHAKANDLWNICKQYSQVVDAFIPDRKSKAGKRYGFIRFIRVYDVERLVSNLCTLWMGSHHLYANVARFQRPPAVNNGGYTHQNGNYVPKKQKPIRIMEVERTQLVGVDVDETFSPVVKSDTIRTVLSLAASRHWPIHQLDVKNAFLHGDLSETVYMHQPLGFLDSIHPDYVCLLQRQGTCTAYLLLYVDDIVLTASSESLLQQINRSLHQEFAIADLGPLNYFLGISVTRDSSELFLSQKKYALEILDMAVMLFSSSTTYLVAYSDADWAGCLTTRRSTFGAEAEYCGVANAVAKTCWFRNLLRELRTLLSSATLVYYDNVSAVYLSCNPVQHQRTKHIEIDIHFVRDLVVVGQVQILHVPSRYQFADIFTKCLSSVDVKSIKLTYCFGFTGITVMRSVLDKLQSLGYGTFQI
nr:ribonuclease H-like domain-containing protein [Tanacetum cinerariifolium]